MATSRRDSSASPIFMHVEPVKGVLRTFTPDQLLRSYAKLQRLVRRAGNGFGHVKYDLTHCPIMDPGAMLLLWYVAGQLKRAGWTPWVGGEGSKAVQMFSRNFDHYLLPQKDPRRQVVANQNPRDYLMRGIETRSDMVNELEEWARTVQSGALVPPEDVALWQMQIAEVTTNGFQHGSAIRQMEPEEIFVAGSTYPKEKYVQLAALDLGSGIPRVIERILYEEHGNHDGDLIEYACAKGVTSRCVRENQGAGLHSLCETVKQNGGSMIILSHNGLHEVASKQPRRPRDLESLDARPPDEVVLDGTLTVINLHIREKEAA